MATQAKEHVKKCCQCVTFKAKQHRAPMESIMATHPLELVHINYLCLEPGKVKEENILVVTDHFTCYAQVYVTWSKTAQTMAKALLDNFIIHYRLLEKILLDQGRNFESKLIANLCKLTGTKKLRTSLYHPKMNGQCKGLTPPLSICWGCCLQSTSLTGKVTLKHWSTHKTAPTIPPWASASISLWMAENADSHWCHPWDYPEINNHFHFYQICPDIEGPH